MKYFHRTSIAPDLVMQHAAQYFGARMQPTAEGARQKSYASALGTVDVSAGPEGGHYTLVTVDTNQPGESELDKLAKRFLSTVHAIAEPGHAIRGAY